MRFQIVSTGILHNSAGTHKDKEQEKNCTQWVEIFLKEYHLGSRDGVIMTTFYLYCSVNHQSHSKRNTFSKLSNIS